MTNPEQPARWQPGTAPVAVVMIALNEAHNMEAVLADLKGWAQEVFLVDSYSADDTVDIALRHGVHVVQRRFRGFGDQWQFALDQLPITAPWTMKLDPDERLPQAVKREIETATASERADGYMMSLRLFFMGRALPVHLNLMRLWRTGKCRFADVLVNEHGLVDGTVAQLPGEFEHHDSPDLDHWLNKQNAYTTAEAINSHRQGTLATQAKLTGNRLERRMWIKRNYMRLPGRYVLLFLYNYLWLGAWRSGWPGYAWSRLRADVYRLWEYKLREIRITGREPAARPRGPGAPGTGRPG